MSKESFPVFAIGKVVKGFGVGNGSRYGFPNARIPYEALSGSLKLGVYFAFTSVNSGTVYKARVTIRWHEKNPTLDVHILHKFKSDFYGEILRICILGDAIPVDVLLDRYTIEAVTEMYRMNLAKIGRTLDSVQCRHYKSHQFFRPSSL